MDEWQTGMTDTRSSGYGAGIMRQWWPVKLMQNEDLFKHAPQTFVDTASRLLKQLAKRLKN